MSHNTIGRRLLLSLSAVQDKRCSHATNTHCFGQTIIPIKLITVSFLSHNVLAKSLPPLNKTQCLWMLGLNLSLRPEWDCIILCNLPSWILQYHWFVLPFVVHAFPFRRTVMLSFNFTRRQNVIVYVHLSTQQKPNTRWEHSYNNPLFTSHKHMYDTISRVKGCGKR